MQDRVRPARPDRFEGGAGSLSGRLDTEKRLQQPRYDPAKLQGCIQNDQGNTRLRTVDNGLVLHIGIEISDVARAKLANLVGVGALQYQLNL